jgi:uncharacterized protein YecE (DUF72 family)
MIVLGQRPIVPPTPSVQGGEGSRHFAWQQVSPPGSLLEDIRNGKFIPVVLSVNPFPLESFREQVATLASEGIYVGTSSWKYEGWLGLIYSPEKYLNYFKKGPPKFVKSRFERTCLAEYAQTFKTVCLDAGFYQFPSPKMLEGYLSQVPADFRLSLKVTEDITILRFPNLPRYGIRAGQANSHFLDADLFIASFLAPLTPYREQIGTIIFEFSHFHPGDWECGREFVEALDGFLNRLPKGWDYSIEIRNESLLHPRYFEVLRKYNVAHAFNSWSRILLGVVVDCHRRKD